jgi:membrane protease YdiL (CAAX protease family)
MRKHPVVWFYILAFGISWLGWIPVAIGSHGIAPFDSPYFQLFLILAAVGPALAAIIVMKATRGQAGVRDLFGAFLRWRVGVVWFIIAVLGPIGLLFAGQIMTKWLDFPVTLTVPQGDLVPLVISAFIMALLSNPWEEVGWRGFALPHLQKRRTALFATLIVGVLWGLWHLPLFFWKANPMSEYPFLIWFIGTVAEAVIFTWLYNSTRGSLLIVTLFHISKNTFGVIITDVSITAMAILSCLVAIVLIVVFGAANLSRHERVRAG